MTVFKTYFKLLKSCLGMIILYSIILISFTVFITTSDSSMSATFSNSKPSILVINKDEKNLISNNLVKYLDNLTNIEDIKTDENSIKDALFYRKIHFILTIYPGFGEDIIKGQAQPLEIQKTDGFQATYTEMLLNQYLKLTNIYSKQNFSAEQISQKVFEALKDNSEVVIKSKINYDNLSKANFYFTFGNYSLLAICIYSVAMVMNKFNEKNVKNKILVSKKKISSFNKELYLSNLAFTFIVWLVFIILGFIITKGALFSLNGMLMILNSFCFLLVALAIAFVIGTFIKNINVIGGITNVISLGTSFLCGAFVPVEMLPDSLLSFSKILPSFWYISNNNILYNLENFNLNTLQPVIINMFLMILFVIVLILLNNFYLKNKHRNM